MLASVLAAMRIPDLKKRITFLFGMFAVYVVGLHISVPGVDPAIVSERFSGGLFDILDAFTGGAALFQSYGTTSMLRSAGAVQGGNWQVLQIAITLVAGTAFLMWLGEQ